MPWAPVCQANAPGPCDPGAVRTRLLAASVALALIGVTGAAIHSDEPQRVETAPARRAIPVLVTTTTTATTLAPTTTTTPPPPPTPATVRAVTTPAPAAPMTPFVSLRNNAPLVPCDPVAFAGF